ncbi:MAG TPA: biotin/lipoyl-containing protein [Bryobacteraceae bacterium]|jgi:methylmalonyl-CoA carboxyltransferase small subunit
MRLNITVDNKKYEVEVEVADQATAPVAAAPRIDTSLRIPAAAPVVVTNGAPKVPDAGPVNEAKVCRSPVSGIVVRIASQVGQKIQSGDTLLVLEAMKMETNITAPTAGKIVRINVGQGDAVQGGMVLVEFE